MHGQKMSGGKDNDDYGQRQSSEADSVTEVHKGYEAQCWGCALWLVLPAYSPVFKCGWCGAISNSKPKVPRSKWTARLWAFRDRLFVLAVFMMIVSIVGGGVWASFPVLFPSISLGFLLHTTLTFLLSFNTFFNFMVASFIAPGPTRRVSWGHAGHVPKGSLEGYSFCDYCKWPKPRGAHHCRTCETCVLNMDHHCPFIGNCVGANNHRHFILFLLYTVVSCLYVFVMALYTGSVVWPSVINTDKMQMRIGFSIGAHSLAIVASSLMESARALALLYLSVASLAIMAGVGILLQQQVSFLYSGTTFLDSMHWTTRNKEREGWDNLRLVFGKGHAIFWALPILPEATPSKIHVR